MWSYLQQLNQSDKTTVFFSTHYMEEAERVAQRIAIIDHGKIVAMGTAATLREETKTESLEEAFLALTGKTIRAEEGSSADRMRMIARSRRGR
jgi:ABC-2 type transport system ATP-binding protein